MLGSTIERSLNDLKSGEIKIISLSVAVKDFAFYNEQKQAWEVEVGTYSLNVGSSSSHIKAKSTVLVLKH